MLSRVASVKAPRTHSLRRVTGSSGRRREGRESEQQRPRMSRHHFCSAVLLLLVMMLCCNTGGAASSGVTAPGSGNAKETYFVWRDKKGEEKVSSLRVPSLVEMDGDVFAVAEAHCKEGTEKVFTGIASKLLALTGEQRRKELATTEVKTQVLEECSSEKEKVTCRIADRADSQSQTRIHVGRPTTVVRGSDIYMLAGSYNWTLTADDQAADAGDWGLMLVKGNVSKEEESKKRILWNDTYAIPWNYKGKQHESLTKLIGGGGSGVKMNDDTLVFPVEGTKKVKGTEKDGKTVSLIIYSSDAAGWVLPKGMSADGCGDPSVVEREKDKELMMMTVCDDGRRRVYESDDKGDSWTEALGTLSRVWGNKHKGGKVQTVTSGFITAMIKGVGDDKKEVMLITLPVYSSKNEEGHQKGNGKGVLHLWLTDNTHIVDIGPVSGDDEDAAASSLLYKSAEGEDNKGELIALYEKKGDGTTSSPSLWSVRLTDQLERVKEVLKTWKEVDERVSKLCPSGSAVQDTSIDTACSPAMPIDGLVGFLSGNFSDNTWRDEYLGVNATVKGNDGEKKKAEAATVDSEKGVRFQGAWAEWPVGSQGENQLYHFANYKFTLVATVSIDSVPEGDTPIPLMGVKMNDEQKKSFGFSYEKGKWKLLCSDGPNSGEQSRASEPGKTQHVVILLRNGTQGSAYVDGQRVGGDTPCALGNTDSKGISHFYIGGDADDAGSKDVTVTVTNVLLYNRPLSSEEIGAFNPNKDSTPPLEENPSKPSPDSSDSIIPPIPPVSPSAQQTETSSTPAGTQLTEQGQSMGSSGAGSGGASAPAVSTVSTSSAEEESVLQVTSGTSPDGNPTVGGGSTADGEPTMETRKGGTNGQEEEVNTQVREINATALSSSLGNVSQGNNTDAGKMRGSGLLPSLLLLLLGLWGFAAL
ncbi:putative trans-sialidase, Group V [Trypanosoma cruzi]|uniref:Putative trans-sialidase, Group V n=1 Tax=Trypanosoma cruzi TaxID=5693 RepID=A0A2V2WGN7_TRYCR|nr:putative trans-sialidase, Group V [Trypanosoma cruzi]